MSSRRLESTIFGRDVEFRYSETWIGYSLLSLRLIMGWTFFYAGITKVVNPEWSVRGYLNYGISQDNFLRDVAGTDIWAVMATDWYWLLTPMNQVGLTLVGIALLLGLFVRFSAFGGAMMMGFYWLAAFPLEGSLVINYHVVYILLLFAVGAFGTGRLFGLDAVIENHPKVKPYLEQYPKLRLLLG